MIARLTFACLLLSTAVHGQSQPPTPGRGPRESGPPQNQTSETEQRPTDNPRGTDKSPLVVQVTPTPKTNEEAAKEKRQEDEQASSQRWTKGLGIATGILGLLQLIAIGFQVRIAWRQNQIIENQSEIMKGQLLATQDAAKTALRANELTEAERQRKDVVFKRANRAYVSLFLPHVGDIFRQFFTDDRVDYAREITLVFQNTGMSEALDFRCNGDWFFEPANSKFKPTFSDVTPRQGISQPIKAGDKRYEPLHRKSLLTKQELDDFVTAGKTWLTFCGRISYYDKFGDQHTKRFHYSLHGGPMRGYGSPGKCHDQED